MSHHGRTIRRSSSGCSLAEAPRNRRTDRVARADGVKHRTLGTPACDGPRLSFGSWRSVMSGSNVLLLGDPRLRHLSEPVPSTSDPAHIADKHRLQITLEEFRARHGFGRAISAPQ